jgi:hypothetical protein
LNWEIEIKKEYLELILIYNIYLIIINGGHPQDEENSLQQMQRSHSPQSNPIQKG